MAVPPTALPPPPARPRRRLPWPAKLFLALAAAMGVALCWAIAVFVFEPGAILPLRTQYLPGIQIDLPTGARDRRTATEYGHGSLMVQSVIAPVNAIVAWDAGQGLDDQATMRILDGLSGIFGQTREDLREPVVVPTPGGLPARSWRMRTSAGVTLWATFLTCGGRDIHIMTATERGNGQRLHRRVLASLQCRPDAKRESDLDDLPVVLDFGPGWARRRHATGQVMVVASHHVFVARPVSAELPDDRIEELLRTGIILGPNTKVRAKQGSAWPCQVRTEGELSQGWISLLHCPERRHSLLLISLTNDSRELDAAQALLQQARCRGRDEAPQIWPP